MGEDGRGVNAFDGDPAPSGKPNGLQPRHPHEIHLIAEVKVYALDTLHYLPRQDGSPSWIKDYIVYVSGNGVDWGTQQPWGLLPIRQPSKRCCLHPRRDVFIPGRSSNEVADIADVLVAGKLVLKACAIHLMSNW